MEDVNIIEVVGNDHQEDYSIKFVIVGDSGVGKTNILNRYIRNTFYLDGKSTIGIELETKMFKIHDKYIKLNIWDTAGQERFKSVTQAYYKGAKGAIMVYDITRENTFNNIDDFIKSNDVDILYVAGRWIPNYVPKNMSFFEKKSNYFYKRINGNGNDWDRCASGYICTKKGSQKLCDKIITYFNNKKKWCAIDNIYVISCNNIIAYDFFPHIYYAKINYNTDVQGINIMNTINTNIFNLL
jgi:hypothetical protein